MRTLSFCQEFSHSALLVIGGNKPSIKRVNLLFYLICVVVQSATIDWKNAGNQWIFITMYCDLSPSVKGDTLCMHLDW